MKEKNTQIVIVGGGGFTKVVINLLMDINKHSINEFEILCIFNDSLMPYSGPNEILGYPVVTEFDDIWRSGNIEFTIAVGDPSSRRTIYEKYKALGINFSTLIHPTVLIGIDSKVGEGAILLSYTSLEPSADVGLSCILNKSVTIGHDSIVGDHSVMHSKASVAGDCFIGSMVLIGQNVSIRQGTTVGDSTTVGAGASVVSNLPNNVVALGVPAKHS